MSRRSLFPCVAVILLFLGAVYGLAGLSVRSSHGLALFSSRRYDPYGTAAFREVLLRKGVRAVAYEGKVPPAASGAVYAMILPVKWDDSDERRFNRLLDWTADGNALLVMSRDIPRRLTAALGAKQSNPDRSFIASIEEDQAEGNYQYQITLNDATTPTGLSLALCAPGWLQADAASEVLASDGELAVSVTQDYGNGRIVLVGDPTPALNYALARDGNLDFLLALVGEGPVYFDEYSLGLGVEDSMLGWLRRLGLGPLVAQALLGLYLLALSARPRYQTDSAALPDDNPAEEQVAVLAGIYEKTLTDDELDRLYGECARCRHE